MKIFGKFCIYLLSLLVIVPITITSDKTCSGNESQNALGKEYVAPGNVEFPLGDEDYGAQDPTVLISCITSETDLEDMHIPCGEFEKPLDPIHSCDGGEIIPEKHCEVCNINIAVGVPGVLVKCHNCVEYDKYLNEKTKQDFQTHVQYVCIPAYGNETCQPNGKQMKCKQCKITRP